MKSAAPRKRSGLTIGVIVVLVIGVLAGVFYKRSPAPRVTPTPATTPVEVPPQRMAEVVFLDPDGREKVRITAEVAADEKSRSLGLMHRRSLGRMHGMLFIFDVNEIQSFWMLNTFLSLDMIFVNEEGRIVTIHKDTTPRSTQSYPSTEPSLYVVEVNAGFADEYGLRVGDRMKWVDRSAAP